MARAADPSAMAPARKGGTRTAPPTMPPKFPARGRYATYMLFGGCSIFFLCSSLIFLRGIELLGKGPEAWSQFQGNLQHPLYVLYHVLALAGFLFTAWRFFIQLFAKSQPPMIGPLPRPPLAVFPPALGAALAGSTALFLAILWGWIP